MKTIVHWYAYGAIVLSFFFMPNCYSQVYKWTDEKGQTHYSARKSDAGSTTTSEVKIPSQPKFPPPSAQPKEYKFMPSPPSAGIYSPPVQRRPQPESAGKDLESDAYKCGLAKDILSGAARHGNGKPTDNYDREVAQNDIRTFCNTR